MCWMIVVGLPPDAAGAAFARLPDDVHAWPCRYDALTDQTGDWPLFIIGQGGCSCGMYQPRARDVEERARLNFRKRRWTQAKIERALAGKRLAGHPGGLRPDVRAWLAGAAADMGACLFVHWTTDPIVVSGFVDVEAAALADPGFEV